MASISSLTGSGSTSSIYGNSNVISGLASGMDTEAMIENAVSGIKDRIAGLNQDRQMLEWEQSAYRSIIDKLTGFSDKYLSYTSSTNLLSAAFFNNSTTVTTSGTYSNLISASGNPSSTVKVLGVKQLAAAATYTAGIGGTGRGFTSKALNLSDKIQTSNVAGSLKLNYDGKDIEINLDDAEVFASNDAFIAKVNEKLTAALEKAGLDSTAIQVTATKDDQGNTNGFKFDIKNADAADFKISSVSGKLAETMGISAGEAKEDGYTVSGQLYAEESVLDAMIGKEFSFTLDGVTKSISIEESDKTGINTVADLQALLQSKIDNAFGSGKVGVSVTDGSKLTFNTLNAGSTLKITDAEELGLSSTATSYVSTSQKISELVSGFQNGDGSYSFTINGKTLTLDKDATIGNLMSKINEDADIGVKVSFSQFTNSFQFTAKETGSAGKVQFGTVDADGNATDLAAALFGVANDTGEDAILSMEVNGITLTDVTRSSNNIEVDGMTIKLNGTFSGTAADAVSFTAAADSDKIVKAIKDMINDYNTMANEIKDAYATQPLRDSKGKRYEPLLEEDAKDMSESAIEKYEKKAKTGILFGDSDLSGLYNELRSAISSLDLEAIGITTAYESGKTTLSLDESKLRSVLSTDPDKVRDTLTKSAESGSAEDGALVKIQNSINKYAKTTGATKGILVNLAGSEKSPLSLNNNSYKDKLDRLQEQISRWETKLSTKIDFYTKQFTALEKMISNMNSQSSALAGMMGY